MQASARRLDSIQALRGLAVLLVMLRHVLVFTTGDRGATMTRRDFLLVGDGGVDIFFVVSGFVMVLVSRKRFGQVREAVRFGYARIARIFPLYWCYTAGLFVVYEAAPQLLNRLRTGGSIAVLPSFLLLPQSRLPLIGQGWSLVHELYFYAVFALFLLVPRERLLPILLTGWAVVVLVANVPPIGFDPDTATAPALGVALHPLTLEFIAGAFIALVLLSDRAKTNVSRCAFAGAAGFIAVGLLQAFRWHELIGDWRRVILFGLPGTLLVLGTVSAELRHRWRFPAALVRLGDVSYSIYLSHVIVLGGIGYLGPKVTNPAGQVVLGAVMMSAAIIVGIVSYQLLEQPLLRLTGRISPRRQPSSGSAAPAS